MKGGGKPEACVREERQELGGEGDGRFLSPCQVALSQRVGTRRRAEDLKPSRDLLVP